MKSVSWNISQEIPVVFDVDVAVVGGGPGGLGAAVMAAKAGAKTLLIERYSMLGGMASVGEVHPFMVNHFKDGLCMDRPVYLDWVNKMHSYLPSKLRTQLSELDKASSYNQQSSSHLARTISKDIAALAAEDICLEAGVKLLFHHKLVGASTKNGKVDFIVLDSKSGFVAVRAKNFVDCSGDADLAAMSGCEFELGDADGNCQPMTLCFKLSHVRREAMPDWNGFQKLYKEGQQSGALSCPRENVLYFTHFDNDVIHFNTTRVQGKCAIDGLELSESEIEARKQLREYLFWLRSSVPGFEQAQIYSMAAHIGVRETRRVKGLAYLTREDFVKRSKFPDAISRCNYPIDIHCPTPGKSGTELVHMTSEEYYEIPYGCVVAKDIANLTIGGRPISVDHAIHSSMRVMPPACTVGQAAGLAAALASQRNCTPASLDGCEVRKKLVEMGAFL